MKSLKSLLVLLAVAAAFTGCGHHHHDSYTVVTVQPGTYEPFTLTLDNQTNETLVPGPLDAQPYGINAAPFQIPPGGTATVSIGYLPSSVTVGAQGVGAFSTFVYPTHTLELGIDYFADSSGATFIYR